MLQQEIETKRMLLAGREAYAEGLRLIYRLEKGEGFWIVASCGEERASFEVGSDLGLAWELFCAVVDGTVTPCVLDEICSDWLSGKSTVPLNS